MSYIYRDGEMTPSKASATASELRDIAAQLALGALIGVFPGTAFAAEDPMEERPGPAATGIALASTAVGAPAATLVDNEAPGDPAPSSLPAASRGAARDYGPSRPGMGTPPSTMDPGHVSIEVALADWQRQEDTTVRADTLLAGATTLRFGVTGTTELYASVIPFGHVRVRDKASDAVDDNNRFGDVTVGFKHNFRNPDGGGLSIAAQPFVVLPIGRQPIGAGDWGAGLLFPTSYSVSGTVSLQLTPEIDAATNGDGAGRHLAYSLVAGVGLQVAKPVQVTIEVSGQRDLDPDGHSTRLLAGGSVAWKVGENLQLDVGGTAGLSRDTPDHRLYVGVSRRF